MQMQMEDSTRTREQGQNMPGAIPAVHDESGANISSVTMGKEQDTGTKARLTPKKEIDNMLSSDHILEKNDSAFKSKQEEFVNKTPSEIMQPPNPLPVKSYDISYANLTSLQQSETKSKDTNQTRKIKIR